MNNTTIENITTSIVNYGVQTVISPSPIKIWIVLLAFVGAICVLSYAFNKGALIIKYFIIIPFAVIYLVLKSIKNKNKNRQNKTIITGDK